MVFHEEKGGHLIAFSGKLPAERTKAEVRDLFA